MSANPWGNLLKGVDGAEVLRQGPDAGEGDAWEGYFQLRNLVWGMQNDPALDALTADEIRMFKSFVILLDMAAQMTSETMRKHVLAHWRPVKQAILKLPIGAMADAAIKTIDGGGRIFPDEHPRTVIPGVGRTK
jgi:hypothetical protein